MAWSFSIKISFRSLTFFSNASEKFKTSLKKLNFLDFFVEIDFIPEKLHFLCIQQFTLPDTNCSNAWLQFWLSCFRLSELVRPCGIGIERRAGLQLILASGVVVRVVEVRCVRVAEVWHSGRWWWSPLPYILVVLRSAAASSFSMVVRTVHPTRLFFILLLPSNLVPLSLTASSTSSLTGIAEISLLALPLIPVSATSFSPLTHVIRIVSVGGLRGWLDLLWLLEVLEREKAVQAIESLPLVLCFQLTVLRGSIVSHFFKSDKEFKPFTRI